MLQTQVSPDMIIHLCDEICDIKMIHQKSNNIEVLPVVPNSIPDQLDKYGGDDHDDGEITYNNYLSTLPLAILTTQQVMLNLHPIPLQHVLEHHLSLQKTELIRKILEHSDYLQLHMCLWISGTSLPP